MKVNRDIRELAKQSGIFLWQVADRLDIWDTDFSRKLRRELPEDEKARIRAIISDLAAERGLEVKS